MAKFCFITGATAGIGLATAEVLWKKGYDLILTGRREERLVQLEKSLLTQKKNSSQQLFVFRLDHTDFESVEKLIQKNSRIFSEVDLLVNNAGLAKGSDSLATAAWSDIQVMIETNLKGVLKVTQCLLPYFIQKKTGTIINLGSVAGRWAYPGGATYCATKAALVSITEALRQELMGTQVRVCNVEPGMVETEFSMVRLGDQEKAQKVYEGMTPLQAHDIAETILWLYERPQHVNIQEIVVFPTDQAAIRQVHRSPRT